MQFVMTYHILPEKGRIPYVKTKTKEETRKQATGAVQAETKTNAAECKGQVVRYLFEKDRYALLDLYNALNGTAYEDSSQLEIVTIESAVYVVMKNDLAYILSGTLSMYEHQSTYSPNLPVRFLIYLAQEYQMVIEKAERSLYGTGQITLPTPQCVVFYNGVKEMRKSRR